MGPHYQTSTPGTPSSGSPLLKQSYRPEEHSRNNPNHSQAPRIDSRDSQKLPETTKSSQARPGRPWDAQNLRITERSSPGSLPPADVEPPQPSSPAHSGAPNTTPVDVSATQLRDTPYSMLKHLNLSNTATRQPKGCAAGFTVLHTYRPRCCFQL